MYTASRFAVITGLLVLTSVRLLAAQDGQNKFEFYPGANYDARIPTFQSVLGYAPGERITSHAGIMGYLDALAAAAPERVKTFEYARSWEGRKLVYTVIGSAANVRRLEEVRAGMQRLADPRRTPNGEAQELMRQMPVVVWLGYGVHGNEISSPDAALLTAYHLLAAQNDPLVNDVLEKVVVLIDPTQNPDGRDRFVHNFNTAEGLEPDASPLAIEHNEPWPGGRTNHYYFDLNRDWFALTQPETQGRVRALQEWYPQVFVDLHEMGSDSTYYFAPEAIPYNPHLAKDQRESLKLFGANNARHFDRFGFSYFTREVYDAFYPGYGASWPSYFGSVAMTYEQASVRGLVIRRSDETIMHFRDSVQRHFIASLSTLETSARNREKLLTDFYNYRRTAIEEGRTEGIRTYILPRRGNTSNVDKLANLLSAQGIEVQRAATPFRVCNAEYPTGSYVIQLAQPAKRLIRTLLDQNVPMEAAFLQEQERRRAKKLPDEIYDVTAWSLPLQYNVEAIACAENVRGDNYEAVKPSLTVAPGQVVGGTASVAYLAPWGTTAAGRLLAAALRDNLRVHSTDKSFVQNGRAYPAGTLIFKVAENKSNLRESLARHAAASGAEVVATNSGMVEEGVDFGSRYVVHLRRPNIAIAWDTPTSSASAGATRFVLERQFGYPTTPIRARQLVSADLSRFQVLILPDAGSDGGYYTAFGAEGVRRLKDWVASGGTLIGIGDGAVSFMADTRVSMLAISQENLARTTTAATRPSRTQAATEVAPTRPPDDAATRQPDGTPNPEAQRPTPATATTPDTTTTTSTAAPPAVSAAAARTSSADNRAADKILSTEDDYLKAIQADTELPSAVPGVILRARLDEDHWITAGVDKFVHAVVQGRTIYSPIKLDKGTNAGLFLGPDQLLASGYLWEENRRQLAYKPFLIVQPQARGVVIGFTADPNFRAYMDGLNMLFINAVFRAPAHARPFASQ